MIIQSVKRATDIISLFTSSQTSLGVTQIAALLGLNKATVWGLITTLEQQGFLQQDTDTLKYGVGPKLFELGMVYVGSLEINAKASRLAHALASRTGLNVRIGIWDGGGVLVTLLALPKTGDSFSHQLGPRVPAHCSGIGKALLAYLEPDELQAYLSQTELERYTRTTIVSVEKLLKDLESTRERGYAISSEEMVPGLVALAAPIFGKTKKLVGAMSISYSPTNGTSKHVDKVAADLLSTAAEISRQMGYYNM
jgi:DNA-binding IclR family transcriptional regulator